MTPLDDADWIEDLTIAMPCDEIEEIAESIAPTLEFTGSRSAAAMLLALTAASAGGLGGLFASGALWSSPLAAAAYVGALCAGWQLIRRTAQSLLGPAMRWQAVLAFFWSFLVGLFAVLGGGIDSAGWAWGVSIGFGLLIGLVAGSLDHASAGNSDAQVLTGLALGPLATAAGTFALRSGYADTLAGTALAAAAAGLVFGGPMAALLAGGWSNAKGLRYLGMLYLHNDETVAKAISCLDRAVALAPDDADLLNTRGIAWSKAGDAARAEADFLRVEALEPKTVEPMMNRAVHLLAAGEIDRAVRILEAAIARDPGHARAHSNLGVALDRRGDFERAIEQYGRAIALKPDYARAYSNRAFSRVRAGQAEAAIEDCDAALRLRPKLAAAFLHRGQAFAALGEREQAFADYAAAIELGGEVGVAREAREGIAALAA